MTEVMMISQTIHEQVDFLSQVSAQILTGDYTHIMSLTMMLVHPNFNDFVEQNTHLTNVVDELVVQIDRQLSHGNEHAFVLRGLMHELGISCPRNEKLAAFCYDHAILNNNAIAMNKRAFMHRMGLGSPLNTPEAIRLYNKAIALGNVDAINNRASMHLQGLGGAINYSEAIRLYEKAIALEQADAMNNRASMHQQGLGGPVNSPEAIRLLERAIRCSMFASAIYEQALEKIRINKPSLALSLLDCLWPDLLAGYRFTDKTLHLLKYYCHQIAYDKLFTHELSTSLIFLKRVITTTTHPLHHIINIEKFKERYENILQTRKSALMFFNRNTATDSTSDHPPLPTELRHYILSLAQPGFIQDELSGQQLDDYSLYSKAETITAIRHAITRDYLPWMRQHTQGIRGLTRFWHWHHGDSGIRRAQELLKLVNDPNCTPKQLAQRLAQVWRASSNTQHSLKTFLQLALGRDNCRRFNLPVVDSQNYINKR